MASAAERVTASLWSTEPPFSSPPPPVSAATALLCDLARPPWSDLPPTPMTPADFADASFPGSAAREWFAARRSLSKRLLAWRLSCRPHEIALAYDAAGAPRLANGEFFFSVAARGSATGLAAAPAPIGIDIELLPGPEPIHAVLHEDERRMLAACDPSVRADLFLRLWTMKEACLKALGCGFEIDPRRLAVSTAPDDSASVSIDGVRTPGSGTWRDAACPGVLAAVFICG